MGLFPNAKKGVGRIYTAQLIQVICGLAIVISAIISLLAVGVSTQAGSGEGAGVALMSLGLITIVSAIAIIVADIINLVGLHTAGKDEPNFKIAFWLIIAVLAVQIVSALMGADGVTGIASILMSVAQLASIFMVVRGVSNLLPNSPIARKGNSVLIAYAIAIVVIVIVSIFATNNAVTVGVILYRICSVVAYILYLVFLGSARKAL